MHLRRGAVALLLMLASACTATTPAREFLPDGGPPVVNGFYEIQSPVCAEKCPDVLATRALPLRARPHPEAPIVATTHEREWLSWIGEIYRMRPVRGVVAESITLEVTPGKTIALKAGDIIYATDTRAWDDVPSTGYWFRGKKFSRTAEGFEQDGDIPLVVTWSDPSEQQNKADEAAGAGWWAQVRRDNGQRGYVLLYDLECWSGGKQEDHCYTGRKGAASRPAASAPPSNCLAQDISDACRALRSVAEPNTASFPKPAPFRDCPDCPSMVWIPKQNFAAGQYEVTFAEWDACVAAGGCNGYSPSDQGWGRGNRPVMNVKWADAQAYVQWLSSRTGKRYRLLTTEEWTTAAFPGGRTQNYSWGNDVPICTPGAPNGVAYNICFPQQTMPVGAFQPNAFGLYDTIGNVGEWLQEAYAPGDARYAIIGSSWASDEYSLGGRGGGWDYDKGPDTGFRVARER